MRKIFLLLVLMVFAIQPAAAKYGYQTDFTGDDFKQRRAKIYEAIGNNFAIIQGAEYVQGFIIFRQSNTFYYLSGLESAGAYMVIDGRRKTTTIYLPHRDEERERGEGQKLSAEDKDLVMKLTGADDVRPVEKMAVDFTYRFLRGPEIPVLYTPHSPDEKFLQSRDEMLMGQGRRLADPFDGRPSKAGHFINKMRMQYPQFQIRDLSPTLDQMRIIKDKKEVDLIRKASQLASLGIMEAMRSTKPGVMEYQLEAATKFVFKSNGARGLSYNAIVGGGENAYLGHYSANSDAVKDGDLILMDTAPDYYYYTSDVTRMWPVNGKYSKDQRDLYGCVIEFHKAFLRHIRPGISSIQLMDEVFADMRPIVDKMTFSKDIYRKACEDALTFRGALQHPVGLSVHDVGNFKSQLLKEGMVFSIDPMIWVREEKLYIRMEDIVVVTKDGVENLSGNLPIEMDDIEKIIAQTGILQKRPPSLDDPFKTN